TANQNVPIADNSGVGLISGHQYTVTDDRGAAGDGTDVLAHIESIAFNSEVHITSHVDGSVTEDVDVDTIDFAPVNTLLGSVSVAFGDPDIAARHTASVQFVSSTFGPGAGTQLGSLDGANALFDGPPDTTALLSYTVDNDLAAVQALGENDTIVETYAVTIT